MIEIQIKVILSQYLSVRFFDIVLESRYVMQGIIIITDKKFPKYRNVNISIEFKIVVTKNINAIANDRSSLKIFFVGKLKTFKIVRININKHKVGKIANAFMSLVLLSYNILCSK